MNDPSLVGIDFEFTRSNEPHPRLFCSALKVGGNGDVETAWLLDDPNAQARLRDRILELDAAGAAFVAYAATAESRCFLALGIDPTKLRIIDLHFEHRLLANWSRHRYGIQYCPTAAGLYIKKRTRSPQGAGRHADKVFDGDGNVIDSSAPVCNLVNARLRFLNVDCDPNAKDSMRELVMLDKATYAEAERGAILAYCATDVVDLHALHAAMTHEVRCLLPGRLRGNLHSHQLARGRWAADTARIESVGIPVHVEGIKKLSGHVEQIVNDAKASVCELWPFFERDKKGKFVRKYEQFVKLIEAKGMADAWPRTATGRFKADEDTLSDARAIPEIDALREALKTEKQVNWYRPDVLPEFMSNVGADGYLRPYYGPFGTQSGRNAAKAKIFPPAQSKWLRCVIRPKAGTVILAADYSSQEFLIAAILSNDRRMIEAYKSGDVYLAFGKMAGMIPADGTKKTHAAERAVCKTVVLGVQYGMGAASLAVTLAQATGRPWRPVEAEALLDKHKRVYADFWEWVRRIEREYRNGEPFVQSDGWALWCENPNPRSVTNFPVQAAGATILRLAIAKMHDAGIKVSWPLHDGIYVLSTPEQAEHDRAVMLECMAAATVEIVGELGAVMRIDAHVHTADEMWVEENAEKMVQKYAPFVWGGNDVRRAA